MDIAEKVLPPPFSRTGHIKVYVTPQEYVDFRIGAAKDNLPMSKWLHGLGEQRIAAQAKAEEKQR